MNNRDISTLEKQHKTAHYLLLATVIVTVLNILFLVSNFSLFIPYCSALSYYLAMLGFLFDGYAFSTYTFTGMIMSCVVLAIWLLVWWQARKRLAWLKAGLVLVIVDTVILALFAFLFLENPAQCLWEALLHIAVAYEVFVGIKAFKLLQKSPPMPDAIPLYNPWEDETPTDMQYDDTIDL